VWHVVRKVVNLICERGRRTGNWSEPIEAENMNCGKPANLFIAFQPNHILAPSTSDLKRLVIFLYEKLVTTRNNTWRLRSEYYNKNNHRYNYLQKYIFRNIS